MELYPEKAISKHRSVDLPQQSPAQPIRNTDPESSARFTEEFPEVNPGTSGIFFKSIC